jgi:hypothetical protein
MDRDAREALRLAIDAAPAANGELDAAAANGLLTGGLARADTGRHDTRPETT